MTEIKVMSDRKQQEIVQAIKEAVALHGQGVSANDSIIKVAEEHGYNENIVCRMCETFNTTKQLAHHRSATPEKRADSFELADFEKIRGQMFNQDPKVAMAVLPEEGPVPSYHHQSAPKMEKAASCPTSGKKTKKKKGKPFDEMEDDREPGTSGSATMALLKGAGIAHDPAEVDQKLANVEFDRSIRLRTAAKSVEYWNKMSKEADSRAGKLLDTARQAIGSLSQGFRKVGSVKWSKFESEALAVHGDKARSLLDAVYGSAKLANVKQARAESPSKNRFINDQTNEHKLLKIALHALDLAADSRIEARNLGEKYQQAKSFVNKQAFLEEATKMISGVPDRIDRATRIGVSEGSPDAQLPADTGIEDEVARAKLKLLLSDLMNDDEVIGQHASEDPARVLQTLQQLQTSIPGLTGQPLALQSSLRRQLEMGQTEPFELEQLRKAVGAGGK